MDVSADFSLLERGGVVIWIIAALSLAAATIIIWKTLRFIALLPRFRSSSKHVFSANNVVSISSFEISKYLMFL